MFKKYYQEPIYIFCKELPVDEMIFLLRILQKKMRLKMSGLKNLFEYAATGMSINQDIDSDLLTVTDINRQNFLSNNIQKLVKEKKEPDLKISNPETIDIIILFQKKSAADCPPIKLTFHNTTTKKNEEIEFYNYFQHLQKFGFVWENIYYSDICGMMYMLNIY